jgi:hypothetical protein
MKKLAVLLLLVVACQKHDDTTTTSTTNADPSAAATTTATTTASATPLATIEPAPVVTASVAPTVAASAAPSAKSSSEQQAAALAKKLDGMNLAVLGALDGTPMTISSSSNVPLDLSAVAGARDAGHVGDLRLGSGGGSSLASGRRGGLAAIGERDH